MGGRLCARARHAAELGRPYLPLNDAFEAFTWEPGYVTNYENVLFGLYDSVPQPDTGRRTGYTASYMESLLMTESGIEVLSKLPRTLTVIGG